MSDPWRPSAGRAENANIVPSGEYAALSPTITTSLMIATVWLPSALGAGVTSIDAKGDAAAVSLGAGSPEAVGSIDAPGSPDPAVGAGSVVAVGSLEDVGSTEGSGVVAGSNGVGSSVGVGPVVAARA